MKSLPAIQASAPYDFGFTKIYVHARTAIQNEQPEESRFLKAKATLHVLYNYTGAGDNFLNRQNAGYSEVIVLCSYPDEVVEKGLRITLTLLCGLTKEGSSIDNEDLQNLDAVASRELMKYMYETDRVDKRGNPLNLPPITPFGYKDVR